MNPDWKNYLTQQGARFEQDKLLDFGHPQQELTQLLETNTLTELTDAGLIALTGKDAKTFLQGQLTCDLNEITLHQSRLGAFCNPKGRMRCIFRLYHFLQDQYLLRLPYEVLPATLTALKKYGAFSKVTIRDVSSEWGKFGLAGKDALTILNKFSQKPITQLKMNQVTA